MAATQKYFHDKLILLLASANAFLAFLIVALLLLRLGIGHGSGDYIVQYRSNVGINEFKTGGLSDIAVFAVFSLLVLATNIIMSVRAYHLRRSLAVSILSLDALLLAVTLIIVNSLLALR
jgi:hypothetical protein